MAKKGIIETTVDGSVLTFAIDGAGSPIVVDCNKLADDIRLSALVHGIRQKVSDGAAIAKAELSGVDVTDRKTKLEAMRAIAERLVNGDWSMRNGDGAGPVSGIIYTAFEEWAMTNTKTTVEKCREKYDGMDRAQQLALRTVPGIATIMERIKTERGKTSGVDADALLADLMRI